MGDLEVASDVEVPHAAIAVHGEGVASRLIQPGNWNVVSIQDRGCVVKDVHKECLLLRFTKHACDTAITKAPQQGFNGTSCQNRGVAIFAQFKPAQNATHQQQNTHAFTAVNASCRGCKLPTTATTNKAIAFVGDTNDTKTCCAKE